MTEAKEAQEEELQVLQAIFGDHVKDLRKDVAWKVWRPVEVEVHLEPTEGTSGIGSNSAFLDLCLSAPPAYPSKPLNLRISNANGVSDSEAEALAQRLRDQAVEAAASNTVVMLELCQVVRDWLHAQTLRRGSGAFASLYEGHLREVEKKQEAAGLQVQAAAAAEAQEIEQELEMRRQLRNGTPAAAPMSPPIAVPPTHKSLATDSQPIPSSSFPVSGTDTSNGIFALSASSRLESEFQILRWLGQGGFGDVIQVRNRLDGNSYAMKRIPLQASSARLRRKITREVKLLSRLNHENVVRYYNSWLEVVPGETETESQTTEDRVSGKKEEEDANQNSLEGLATKVEAPTGAWAHSTEWSLSYGQAGMGEEESSEESEDDEPFFGPTKAPQTPEDSVIFETTSNSASPILGSAIWQAACCRGSEAEDKAADECDEPSKGVSSRSPILARQIMYLQMEYCENGTLRESIDRMETFSNPRRSWRLFREVLEGLCYIHNQVHMIHRDIKPVNIFVDALDHAKIGDFGLACASGAKAECGGGGDMSSLDDSSGLTTDVGTALYVAPELVSTASPKAQYNHKVDVFSLGIVLFELFQRPLKSGMERVSTLRALRSPNLTFPDEFGSEIGVKQKERLKELIGWMMKWNVEERAGTDEILKSSLLPPVEMGEVEFQDAVTVALAHPQTRSYKWLLARFFAADRMPSVAHDYCYDQELDMVKNELNIRRSRLWSSILFKIHQLFRRRGAVQVSVPPLLPKSRLVKRIVGDKAVEVMDPSGMLVLLPWDLRLSFARWVVRQKISRMKRYDLGSVFRPPEVPNSHPIPRTEAAMDVVCGPATAHVAAAEVISALAHLVKDLGWLTLGGGKLHLRINHSRLLHLVLNIAGVKESEEKAVLEALESAKCSSREIQRLLALIPNFSDRVAAHISAFTSIQGSLDSVYSQLRTLTHTYRKWEVAGVGGVAALLKETRNEFDRVEKAAVNLGLWLPLTVDLGLVTRPAEYNSGLVFQLSYEIREEKSRRALKSGKEVGETVLAAGGRYDALLEELRKPAMEEEPPAALAAVGVSISLAPFLNLALKRPPEERGMRERSGDDVEVLVCSSTRENSILMEKLAIVRSFWSAGIPADFLHEPLQSNIEDLEQHCRESGIPFLLLVKGEGQATAHLLKYWLDAESRFVDLKVFGSDVVPTVEGFRSEQEAESWPNSPARQVSTGPPPTDDRDRPSQPASLCANPSNINVTFLVSGGKGGRVSGHNRKNYEQSVGAVLGGLLGKLSPRVVVEVLATDLRKEAVSVVAATISLRASLTAFRDSFARVRADLPNALKGLKDSLGTVEAAVTDIAYRSGEPILDSSNIIIVLYAYHDETFRILS